MEKVTFKNSRGLNLVADLYKSSETSIVILLHGFTGDKHEWGRFDQLAKALQKSGLSVLALDFSGSGESDDDSLTVDKQVDDFHSTLTFLKANGFSNIGVVGLSLGGLVALKGFRSEIDALVLWAPVTNKRANYFNRFTPEQQKELDETGKITKKRTKGIRKVIVIDKQMVADRENINQEELLSPISVPTFIIHGDKDDVVPITDSEQAIKLLPENSQLIIVPKADHGFYEQMEQFIESTTKWLTAHLN